MQKRENTKKEKSQNAALFIRFTAEIIFFSGHR